jgi:VanZ family protein
MIKWLEKNHKISLVLTFLVATLIFHISSITFPTSTSSTTSLKPIFYHIIIFFIFTFFLSISILKGKNKLLILPTIIMSILYAISDELHQFFVPGRMLSLSDIFLDTIGIILASTLYIAIVEYRLTK